MASYEPHMSTSADSNIVPTIPYARNRFADPIRLAIPPPHLDFVSGEPVLGNLILQPVSSHDYGSSEYGNPDFLQYLRSSCSMRFGHKMLSWEYNMRRTAQPILPYLILGPSTAARDVDYIHNTGITMLISVRSAVSARASPKYLNASMFESAAGLSTITLDLDSPYDLITQLPKTIKAMNDHLENGCAKGPTGQFDSVREKILVFCESGNERSTALVAAYLMVLFGVDVVTAMQIIQSQRFCIAPEDGMKNMLTTFEDVLKAKRDVSMQKTQSLAANTNTGLKRNVDMMYDDDDEMEDGTDQSDVAGTRKEWAPFRSK
jgi:serine/threonine/tyrosine-interacting protein